MNATAMQATTGTVTANAMAPASSLSLLPKAAAWAAESSGSVVVTVAPAVLVAAAVLGVVVVDVLVDVVVEVVVVVVVVVVGASTKQQQ